MAALRSGGKLSVELSEGETDVESETAVLATGKTVIYLDVRGFEKDIASARLNIDRIIMERQPNASRPLHKWDGLAAGIIGLEENMPSWVHTPADEDEDVSAQYSGSVTVLWAASATA